MSIPEGNVLFELGEGLQHELDAGGRERDETDALVLCVGGFSKEVFREKLLCFAARIGDGHPQAAADLAQRDGFPARDILKNLE